MRTGLLGGSFDPVHRGHLLAASRVAERLSLDKVVFIPARVSPHKDSRDAADPSHRLGMLELSTRGEPRFGVCDVELRRPAPSYTVDTLRILGEKHPSDELYFMAGIEVFAEIDTWKDFGEIFRLANFVVMRRPGYRSSGRETPVPLALENDFRYSYAEDGMEVLIHSSSNRLIFLDVDGVAVSSTQVRECARGGLSLESLVSPEVESYIAQNGLYLPEEKP